MIFVLLLFVSENRIQIRKNSKFTWLRKLAMIALVKRIGGEIRNVQRMTQSFASNSDAGVVKGNEPKKKSVTFNNA